MAISWVNLDIYRYYCFSDFRGMLKNVKKRLTLDMIVCIIYIADLVSDMGH